MAADQTNRNAILSQIIAGLSAQSQGGEDLSSKTRRLREEIKKVIENEDTMYGKIRGLVESFREIIPEESQRYNAAVKALSATSKLTPQEIVKGVNNQLEELKILEKSLLSSLPGWRDELKAMEAKARGLRDDIARLRETIGRLESEEKGILSGIAVRQKEMELVEKAVGEVFTDIGAVITSVKKKIEESSAESAAAPPIPPLRKQPITSDIFPGESVGSGQTGETSGSAAPQDKQWQKKCPMCGGRMDFHSTEKMWMCYSCAYEELAKEEIPVKSEEKSETIEPSAPQQDTAWQKKCPMCGGRMDFHANEQLWMCYSCGHEEKGDYTNAPEPAPASEPVSDSSSSPSIAVPLADMSSSEDRETIKGTIQGVSLSKNHPTKKKTCPACRKKMNWYEDDRAWRCPFCEYERRL
jgi:ribosomal protein L37AE/L43A/predicted  nucleic acid-binding Zn-ribbon protein